MALYWYCQYWIIINLNFYVADNLYFMSIVDILNSAMQKRPDQSQLAAKEPTIC